MARKWRPTTAHEYFWQNIEEWSPTDTSYLTMPFHTNDIARVPAPALGVKVLEDIMASCQTALLAELERREDYAEIDITESKRPWPRIIAVGRLLPVCVPTLKVVSTPLREMRRGVLVVAAAPSGPVELLQLTVPEELLELSLLLRTARQIRHVVEVRVPDAVGFGDPRTMPLEGALGATADSDLAEIVRV